MGMKEKIIKPKNNPLIELSNLRDQAVPFDQIKNDHFLPALEFSIADSKEKIALIKNNTEPISFSNTVLALETSSDLVDYISGVFFNLHHAEATEDIQELTPVISAKLAEFSSDVSLDSDLFKKIKTAYDQMKDLDLNLEQKRLLEDQYNTFSRNGALLSIDDKEKIRQIDKDLSALAPKYSENLLKATNDFKLWIDSREDLKGLPDSAIDAAALAAKENGESNKWLFTLASPSFTPFMKYIDNEKLRKKMWFAFSSRAFSAPYNNQEIILKIVNLRHQRAQILDYKSHADFVLKERMAKDPKTVQSFLQNLYKTYKPAAEKDLDELKKFRQELDGSDGDIFPWDFGYYSNKLQEKKLNFNSETLRPYFKLENVLNGVFQVAEKLYDLSFTRVTDLPVYHKDVKVYEVRDKSSSEYIGLFYTDFFPRPTKQNGAWATGFRSQGFSFGKDRRPHASIVCNFTKPTETTPSLITFQEATTLFHEFGHAIHGLLSQCQYCSLSGNHVLWDFVELPSQIMENWMKEKSALELFAHHYKTGELISDDLIEKIKAQEQFQAGYFGLRQLNFSFLDMAWHSSDPSNIKSVVEFEKETCLKTTLTPYIENTNFSVSFSHIFAGGYSSGYYSYKWAEVLDADAFALFQEKGVFNHETAKNFKKNILSRGNTESPDVLYRKFRGRDPQVGPLLKREGLLSL